MPWKNSSKTKVGYVRKGKIMRFTEALKEMKNGNKVKLPSWGGYWTWDEEKQTILMHCRPGNSDNGKSVLDIRETLRVEYTLSNIMSDEWVLADETNTPILGGVATFNFGEAIKYLKRGFKVARQGWNGKDQFLVYIDPYNNDQFKLIEAAPLGTFYGYVAIKTNYNAIVPWLASQTDMLAEDWVFVE